MTDLELFLSRHAIRSPDDAWHDAPVREALAGHTLVPLAAGLQTRVFRLKGEPWVLKEGRWDLEVELAENVRIPLYARLTERVLGTFSFSFLPTEREMRRQLRHYHTCRRYFGYGAAGHEPESEQLAVRDALPGRMKEIASTYRLRVTPAFADVLRSPAVRHNFLPHEHMLVGQSFSPENEGERTFFIFQEFIQGSPLHDHRVGDLPPERRRELMVWMFLALVLHCDTHLLPDTRPRYPLAQSYDWFSKTDNIFIAERGVTFVDTRWFWETDANIVRSGLIIPHLTVRGITWTLQQMIDAL